MSGTGAEPGEQPYPVQSVVAVGEENWVRHWEVHVRMDLSEIVDVQDGLLENEANFLFNDKLTSSVTPNAMRRQKVQTSLLCSYKIRVNVKKSLTRGL